MTTLELLDDPAAQDTVALIQDQRLAGTQGLLRFLEFYGEGPRRVLLNPAGDCRRGVPVFDVHVIQGLRQGVTQPIYIMNRARLPGKVFCPPQDDRVGFRVHFFDVEAFAACNSQPFSLAGRIKGNAAMFSDCFAFRIKERARPQSRRACGASAVKNVR